MDFEHERRLTETEARSKSNSKQIEELKGQIDAVNELARSVAVMAEKMDVMSTGVDKLATKVEALEAEPAKKWRFVVEKAIYFVVAAVMGFALAHFGL